MYQKNSTDSKTKRINFSSILILSILISGCNDNNNDGGGGNGGNGGNGNKNGFTATYNPVDGSRDNDTTRNILATFNADVMATTVTGDSFTLMNNNTKIPASVSYSVQDKTATLDPTNSLNILTTYTAKLSKTISDISGNSLGDKSWNFATKDGQWGSNSTTIGDTTITGLTPQIAVNDNGDALAVWYAPGFTNILKTSRYSASTRSWSDTINIRSRASNGINKNIQLALMTNGDAVAVWEQSSGTGTIFNVYASQFTTSGTGVWSSPVKIDVSNTTVGSLDMSKDSTGNVIAVWNQDNADSSATNIWANRYDSNTKAWGTATVIEQLPGNAIWPQIAFNKNSIAMVVWRHRTEVNTVINNVIRASLYNPTAGGNFASRWSTSVELSDITSEYLGPTNVVNDASGNFHASWLQTQPNVDGSLFMITHYTGNWSIAAPITNTLINISTFAVDTTGRIIAIWEEYSKITQKISIFAKHFVNGKWGTARLLQDNIPATERTLNLMIDAQGNALAIWNVNTANINIYSARYSLKNDLWSPSKRIDLNSTAGQGDAILGGSGMAANGSVTAIWSKNVQLELNNIHTIRFE